MKTLVISYNDITDRYTCVGEYSFLEGLEYSEEENELGRALVDKSGKVVAYDRGDNERVIICLADNPHELYTTINALGESDNDLENIYVAEAVLQYAIDNDMKELQKEAWKYIYDND